MNARDAYNLATFALLQVVKQAKEYDNDADADCGEVLDSMRYAALDALHALQDAGHLEAELVHYD